MGRGWKPGEVAAVNDVTDPDRPYELATCITAAVPGKREAEWLLHRTGARVWSSVSDARPIVVIDPEDREQCRDLADRIAPNMNGNTNATQAALRSLAEPPKPKCVAHGEEECGNCSRIVSTQLTDDGACRSCETYAETGMHWDTCPGRIRGTVYRNRDEARGVQS